MAERYALDSNIILRYLLGTGESQFPKARHIFDALDDGTITGYLDPVILAEIVWVLKSFYKLTPSQVTPLLLPLVKHPHIVVSDRERYIAALELYATVDHFGDACACALALETCDGQLLSFDRKLGRVPDVRRAENC